jgi:hypothetical protein
MTPKEAVECLSAAFKADPDYAHTWHCNIAMAMYDELTPTTPNPIEVCNRAATRFMKNAFDVETAQEPKP